VMPAAGRSFSISRPVSSPARTGQAFRRRQNANLDLTVLERFCGWACRRLNRALEESHGPELTDAVVALSGSGFSRTYTENMIFRFSSHSFDRHKGR
jgi:hypothetical protein